MEERRVSNKKCEHARVAAKFCWHCWLKEQLEDREFIGQLERAVATKLGPGATSDDVDEVLQEVWLKLLERSRELDGKKNYRGYVMSAVLGTALEFRKRRNRARKRERTGLPADEALHPVAGRARPPDEDKRVPVLPQELAPLDNAALIEALQMLAQAASRYHAAADGTKRERRKHYRELLRVLEKHEFVSAECIAYLRMHKPKTRAIHGVSTLVATGRVLSFSSGEPQP